MSFLYCEDVFFEIINFLCLDKSNVKYIVYLLSLNSTMRSLEVQSKMKSFKLFLTKEMMSRVQYDQIFVNSLNHWIFRFRHVRHFYLGMATQMIRKTRFNPCLTNIDLSVMESVDSLVVDNINLRNYVSKKNVWQLDPDSISPLQLLRLINLEHLMKRTKVFTASRCRLPDIYTYFHNLRHVYLRSTVACDDVDEKNLHILPSIGIFLKLGLLRCLNLEKCIFRESLMYLGEYMDMFDIDDESDIPDSRIVETRDGELIKFLDSHVFAVHEYSNYWELQECLERHDIVMKFHSSSFDYNNIFTENLSV